MKPPSSGPTAAAIAAAAPTSAYDLLLGRAFEVAVDERLHRGQQQRRAEPADDRPEDDDRRQALRERHRQRADRVAEQAEHVGALAPDEVADLAADEDERGRDQRLERDRRLDAADGRVEVLRPPPRSTRSSATCRRRARTSPSPAAARGAASGASSMMPRSSPSAHAPTSACASMSLRGAHQPGASAPAAARRRGPGRAAPGAGGADRGVPRGAGQSADQGSGDLGLPNPWSPSCARCASRRSR